MPDMPASPTPVAAQPALASASDLSRHLEEARVRYLCTTRHCHDCGEPVLPDRPVPRHFDPESGRVVRSGGLTAGLAHARTCAARGTEAPASRGSSAS